MSETFQLVATIVAESFRVPLSSIRRETTADMVQGWDSLAHSILIATIESRAGIELPIDQLLELQNVGELVDLIDKARGS